MPTVLTKSLRQAVDGWIAGECTPRSDPFFSTYCIMLCFSITLLSLTLVRLIASGMVEDLSPSEID
jgi:hypothetical protein